LIFRSADRVPNVICIIFSGLPFGYDRGMDYAFVSTQMIPQDNSTVNSTSIRSAPKVKLKGIAFPTEHGAWGMVFEPIVAALAVAFSVGGLWVAVAFVGAFLMRQPFKVLMAERAAGRKLPQGAAARRFRTSQRTCLPT